MTNDTQVLIQTAKADEELQRLAQTIKVGWPEKIESVHPSIRKYWTVRDELYQADGISKLERSLYKQRSGHKCYGSLTKGWREPRNGHDQ